MLNKKRFFNPIKQLPTLVSTIQSSFSRDITSNKLSIFGEYHQKNYRGFFDFTRSIQESLMNRQAKSMSLGTLTCYPNETHTLNSESQTRFQPIRPNSIEINKESWFFINNAGLSPAMAMINCQTLAKTFYRPIQLIHLQSEGMFGSLTGSGFESKKSVLEVADKLTDHLAQTLEVKNKIVVICHGAGTAVAKKLIENLAQHSRARHLLNKLEFYSIGSILKTDLTSSLNPEITVIPYVEHFVNQKDLFAMQGILAHQQAFSSPVYTLNKRGHLLNNNYLADILCGKYCQERSRLFQYISNKA